MSPEAEQQMPGGFPDIRVPLAYERTFLAHERTQMAWLRTGLALISFGFAIAKFYELLREKHAEQAPLLSPRMVGILMIAIGIAALTGAGWQHRQAVSSLRKVCPDLPPSFAGPFVLLLAVLGIFALISALIR